MTHDCDRWFELLSLFLGRPRDRFSSRFLWFLRTWILFDALVSDFFITVLLHHTLLWIFGSFTFGQLDVGIVEQDLYVIIVTFLVVIVEEGWISFSVED